MAPRAFPQAADRGPDNDCARMEIDYVRVYQQ